MKVVLRESTGCMEETVYILHGTVGQELSSRHVCVTRIMACR